MIQVKTWAPNHCLLSTACFCFWPAILFAAPVPADTQPAGEILYNGIRLSAAWPPRPATLTREPMSLPYLDSPPAVIPIDVGRQLFIDDFLIEHTTLRRTFHAARYIDGNPVLKPDKPWETTGRNPMAMVFSDGVWFDPADHLFKMWYMGGESAGTCYATSGDGIHWEKPALDSIRDGTNIVQLGGRDSSTVWLDLRETNRARRYKMFCVGGDWKINVYFSPDGIHWGAPVARTAAEGDRSTVFFNPFRSVWVFSLRCGWKYGRARKYWEGADLLEAARYGRNDPPFWVGADRLDMPRNDLKTTPQLYNLDAAAYENVMLGLFTIWRGQPTDRPKPNEVLIGFGRDGYHWDRANREPFIPVSEHKGDWNWGNVQSAGGGCLVVGDNLYFYVSGRAGNPGKPESGVSTTGLATLRRDGFASMDTPTGATTATTIPADQVLVTRPLRFSGKFLFVNADMDAGGALSAEIVDENGAAIAPWSIANCIPVRGGGTKLAVSWKDKRDLAELAGRPVRFAFHFARGKDDCHLYSFWVSPDSSGSSRGFVAAGGPGFDGPIDSPENDLDRK